MTDDSETIETNLVAYPLEHLKMAQWTFGDTAEGRFTPIVLVPDRRAFLNPRFVIPHGFDCVVTHHGKLCGVYKPGLYYRSPYYQIAYLVNKQFIPYHFAITSCPTRDNVRVDIQVDFLFHVADSLKFCLQIAPENMEELLRATQAEAVRSLVRSCRVAEARDLRGVNSEDMVMALNEKLNPYGISIDHVAIANVILPNDVAMNLQNTTAFESKHMLQMKSQMLNMKVMDNAEYVKAVEAQRQNEKQKTIEEQKKQLQVVQQDLTDLDAKLKRELQTVSADLNDKLAQLKAQADLELGRIMAERDKQVSDITSAGKLEAQKAALEAIKYEAEVRAKTSSRLAELKAKSIEAKAEAEQYAGAKLAGRRQNQLALKRLEMYDALAKNPNVFISGKVGDSPLAQLLAATRAATTMGINVKASPKQQTAPSPGVDIEFPPQ